MGKLSPVMPPTKAILSCFDTHPTMSTTETETLPALQVLGLAGIETTASAAALDERDRLLNLARRGTSVTDGASAQRATEILKELKAFSRGIESARKDVKEPVLQLGKDIDALAATLTDDLAREENRIAGLIGAWQAEQNHIAEEARRKAWEEEQRIRREAEAKDLAEQERLAAEQRAREDAARKVQEELEAKAARARSEAGRAKALAEAEAARARAEADRVAAEEKARAEGMKRDEQEALAIGKAHASAAVVQQTKPQGVSARREVEFEVVDIVALYEACAPLVKLEPNTAAIKAALKQLPEGKSLPGIRHWFRTSAVVR